LNEAEKFPRTPGNESHPPCPKGRPGRIHLMMTSERRHASEDGIVEELSVYIFELEAKIATLTEAGYKVIEQMQMGGWIDTLGHNALMNVHVAKLATAITNAKEEK